MLTGSGLGEDFGLAHPFGEQHLPDGIVYFVGAGVVQVFAFQIYVGVMDFAQPVGTV